MSVDLTTNIAQMFAYVHGCNERRFGPPCKRCQSLARQAVESIKQMEPAP